MQRGRVRVVRGLRQVDVVVRAAVLVFALLVAHQLERAVGDHLVRVHVGRGARAALEHVQAELVVQLPVDQLLARSFHPRQDLGVELAAVEVRARGRHLDHAEGPDEVGVEPKFDAGNVEVLEGAGRLHAVVGVAGNRLLAEEVVLDPDSGLRHGIVLSCVSAGQSTARSQGG